MPLLIRRCLTTLRLTTLRLTTLRRTTLRLTTLRLTTLRLTTLRRMKPRHPIPPRVRYRPNLKIGEGPAKTVATFDKLNHHLMPVWDGCPRTLSYEMVPQGPCVVTQDSGQIKAAGTSESPHRCSTSQDTSRPGRAQGL